VKTNPSILVSIVATALLVACAGAQVEGQPGGGGSQGGEGGARAGGGNGAGGTISINLDAPVLASGPEVGSSEPLPDLSGYKCDDAGNCTLCQPVRILSLGQPAKYGAGSGSTDNTKAFQDFMNSNTGGTATMTMVTKSSTIKGLNLDQYDVVILQALEDSEYTGLWSFTSDDSAALRDWVSKGGALITMSGYGGNPTEVNPLNQLLGNGADNWSGISYNTDDTFNSCPNNLCYCAYSSVAFDGWQTSCAACAAITVNHDKSTLGKVGVFHGRSINCTGSDCQVFAKDPTYGIVGVAKTIGSGRVVAWGDEWVTYTSQWGLAADTSQSAYDDPNKSPQCVGQTPYQSYVVPQFWYNVFRWAAQTSCLTIVLPPTVSTVQGIVY
jgi:hypothetical protein